MQEAEERALSSRCYNGSYGLKNGILVVSGAGPSQTLVTCNGNYWDIHRLSLFAKVYHYGGSFASSRPCICFGR